MTRWQEWPKPFRAVVLTAERLANTGHDWGAARETFLKAAQIAPDADARQEMRDRAKQCVDHAIADAIKARRARLGLH